MINNAGIAYREPFLDIPLAHWDAVMDINVRAVFRLGQLAAERMIRQGTGGSIVKMSSKNGLADSSMLAHYNASKAGVILLSQSMAVELAPYGIRVNVVAPGFVETPLDLPVSRVRRGQLRNRFHDHGGWGTSRKSKRVLTAADL
ncbi:SDR family NAD(P)-dependent oxidoreductase [Paenibacillus sp. A3]|uniref:SDR family NAD(P)-dependent oxidoreductase n=1 Tax=Paenibacillus sp. A3 TaxID=1337054 RepID=UPI000A892D7F|nr:SDR family oxidoreductase [Paenibacillus sp. A3]